jgi:hypothetical protein
LVNQQNRTNPPSKQLSDSGFGVDGIAGSFSEQNDQPAEWEKIVFIIGAQTLKRVIALRKVKEREADGHFDRAELAEAAASIGLNDPEAHAEALVQVNQDFTDFTRTLEVILADDPNGAQFTVPSEDEFRAGREIVEAADELKTQFKPDQWFQ